MIPLRDSIPSTRRPVVTQLMIALCTVVFVWQLGDPQGLLLERLGMVPARVFEPGGEHFVTSYVDSLSGPRLGRRLLLDAWVPDWLTLLTCTFLHGGWLHFLGNMLFLWIFGDNVEDRFGRVKFLLFYLGAGAAASAAHLLTAPGSTVPTIGASGAIAGVMGAYMFLYPHSRVQMLFIWGFFVDVVVLPAPFFLGYWFLLQLVPGLIGLGNEGGGVAWWAHIGGFVVGAGVAAMLRAGERLRPAPAEIALNRRRFGRFPPPRF